MPCEIHNPSINAITVPYPGMGIVGGGESKIVNLSVAAVEAALGVQPKTGGLKFIDRPDVVTGFDSFFEGFIANTGGNSGGDYTVSGALVVTGAAQVGTSLLFDKEVNHTVKVNDSTGSGTAGANLTMQAGAATAGNANGGVMTMNAGAKSGSGTNGTIGIGTSNTSAITMGGSAIPTTFGGDIDATGGFRMPVGPFVRDNVAASLTDSRLGVGATAAPQVDVAMPRAGSLVGLSASFTVAPAGSTLTVNVFLNGALMDAAATLAVTAGAALGRAATFTKDTAGLAFVAGDRIGVAITTDGSWTATGSDACVTPWVEC